MEKTMVMQVDSLQPMEDQRGEDIHTTACGGPHTRADRYYLNEAAACGKPNLEQKKGVKRKEQHRGTVPD
ncbi:hypothetical protein AV530_016973 [Patagioenas fasciata monilis]|uniref:Uncharacterized protein n=1 Tax=Patagioenas fasciata monilis TaxID=372326 RepID=A0A1V4J4K2_PATFA|nr:hypothetical protein AV530_016973 [Patagioenas fasciata monilis]